MSDTPGVDVVHFVQGLARGGVESLLLDVVRETESVDHAVGYLTERDASVAPLREAGATVTRLDVPWASPRTVFDPRSVREATRFVRRVDPEVVHAHYPLYLHVLGRLAGALADVDRVVGTYHNPVGDFHPLMRRLERATRPLSDGNVGVSEAVSETFAGGLTRYVPGVEPTETIYNGIDVTGFNDAVAAADADAVAREWGIDRDAHVFLSVGRYTPQKSQATLVEAMADVVDAGSNAHLLLVGHGPLESDLRDRVADRGLGDAVTVTGEVPSVHEYYALADVFVSSSAFEGLPIVLLEAMAAELPVVATAVSGSEEVVVDGETGRLVPPNDPGRLADAMRALATSDRRERYAESAYARALDRFDVSRTVEGYRELYDA